MVHEINLFQIKNTCPPETAETLMVETRIRLLKIPEVMNLSCGKVINSKSNPYHFFVAMEFENLAKRDLAHDNAIFVKYEVQVIKPNVSKTQMLQFEMEPGKDVAYS
ncbi:MAG: hypothetical protein AAF558_01000 [Verrucomicrobiota bacterium]